MYARIYRIITQLIRISIDCFISVDRSGKMSLHINMQNNAFCSCVWCVCALCTCRTFFPIYHNIYIYIYSTNKLQMMCEYLLHSIELCTDLHIDAAMHTRIPHMPCIMQCLCLKGKWQLCHVRWLCIRYVNSTKNNNQDKYTKSSIPSIFPLASYREISQVSSVNHFPNDHFSDRHQSCNYNNRLRRTNFICNMDRFYSRTIY